MLAVAITMAASTAYAIMVFVFGLSHGIVEISELLSFEDMLFRGFHSTHVPN